MFSPNCAIILPCPEISLKSPAVRSFMLNRLKKNCVLYLKHFGVDYSGFDSLALRMVIKTKDPKNAVSSLKDCFGINFISLAQEVEFSSLVDLCAKAVEIASGLIERGTFAVRGKSFSKSFSSKKLEEEIGRNMLDSFSGLKVKLKDPENEFHCLTYKNTAYFFFSYIDGAKGMPIGTQGRVGLIVSNDSNVKDLTSVGKSLMKCGCVVALVKDFAKNKTNVGDAIIEELAKFNCFRTLRLFSVSEAKKIYSSGEIAAFFSCAKSIKEAEKGSKLVGVKVFAPLLI